MTDLDRFARLSDHQLHEIHAACETFEQALLADRTARIEEWLARVSAEIQDVLFRELLAIELETHAPFDGSRVADFLARFPDRNSDIHQVMQEVSETFLSEGGEPLSDLKKPDAKKQDSGSRYQLGDEIARGGMGVIFRGFDTSLDRDLAIKVLHDSLRNNPEVVHRFVEEAQIGARLQHPGIAPIYELGQFAEDRPFFAMKLVKGETLAKLLTDRKSVSEDRGKLIGIFEQVCQTVAYAHSCGVIHRDLKPANVMVGAFGEVQVMDWGLAKVLSAKEVADETHVSRGTTTINPFQASSDEARDGSGSSGSRGLETRVGSVMGTPAYMSPEQARGEIDQMDERADVFGLGAILCEILTGQPPFVGTNATQIVRQASSGRVSDCIGRLESCEADEELIALAAHCLEPQAKDRPRDAGVLANRISGYLESVETKLRKTEVELAIQAARADAEATQREAERRRMIQEQQAARHLRKMVAGVAAIAAIAIGTSLVATKYWRDARIATGNANHQKLIAERHLEKAETSEQEATEQRNRAAKLAENAQQELYYSQMHLAQQVWREHRGVGNMVALLGRWLPKDHLLDRRGWEWYYLKSLPLQNVRTYTEDRGFRGPTTVAWNVAQNQIAEGNRDGVIRIWDVEAEKPILVLTATSPTESWPGETDRWLAWSPDGRRLVAGFQDKAVRLWDTNSGHELRVLRGLDAEVVSVAFNSAGNRVAAWGANGSIMIWDVSTGQITGRAVHPKAVTAAAWSLDDASLTSGHPDGTVTISGTHPDDKVETFRVSFATVTGLAWSPDEKQLAVASRSDHAVRIVDVASKKVIGAPLRHSHAVTSVEWEPGGKRLATAGFDQAIKIWNTTTWTEDFTLRGNAYPVTSLSWGIDGRLVSASSHGIVKVWNAKREPEAIALVGADQPLRSVAWSPDGQQLAAGDNDATIRIWNLETSNLAMVLREEDNGPLDHRRRPNHKLSWSPDGLHLASSGRNGRAKIWQVATGQVIYSLPLDHHPVISVAWSPSGEHLAFGCQDGKIEVVEGILRNPKVQSFDAHDGGVGALAWSPQGSFLASGGSDDNLAKVWDPSTGTNLTQLQGHASRVGVDSFGLAWSPDGNRLVSCAGSGEVILWNATTGENLATLSGHSDAVYAVAWTLDGTRIATAGVDDTVRIWDPLTGQETFLLRGHLDRFFDTAWHRDSRRLAAACDDGTIRIWDARLGFD